MNNILSKYSGQLGITLMFLLNIFLNSSAYYKFITQGVFITTQVCGHINFSLDFLLP